MKSNLMLKEFFVPFPTKRRAHVWHEYACLLARASDLRDISHVLNCRAPCSNSCRAQDILSRRCNAIITNDNVRPYV